MKNTDRSSDIEPQRYRTSDSTQQIGLQKFQTFDHKLLYVHEDCTIYMVYLLLILKLMSRKELACILELRGILLRQNRLYQQRSLHTHQQSRLRFEHVHRVKGHNMNQ